MEFYDTSNAASGKIDGVTTVRGGVYDELRISGVCTTDGDIYVNKLDIDGVCTCSGNVEAKHFSTDGVLTIHGNLRAGFIDIDGVVTVNGATIYADQIVCDGILTAGEVSADEIKAHGKINAREIVGDRVFIQSFWRGPLIKLLFKISQKTKFRFSEIDLIEATSIDIRGVRAKLVRGTDITIGAYCEIDRVDCCGTLRIDETAKIGELSGAYTTTP